MVTKKSTNKYSKNTSQYFYEGNNKISKIRKSSYQWENEPIKRYINHYDTRKPLFVTKFDSISKSDSIFAITNEVWEKVGERTFSKKDDSIYHRKLAKVKFYNEQYKVVEEKNFKIDEDYENKKVFLSEHIKYEYDEAGNVNKRIYFKDGKYYYYTILGNGKIIKEERPDDYGKTSYTAFTYNKDRKLEKKTNYSDNKISDEMSFEYNNDHVSKLFYSDKFGSDNKPIRTTVVIFKYKFDKHKNWTEIIKNVNGKDLYKWVRKIEYYK